MFWNRRRPKDDLIGGKKVRSIHNSRLFKPHLIEQYLKSKSQYPNVSELKVSIPGKYIVPISNVSLTILNSKFLNSEFQIFKLPNFRNSKFSNFEVFNSESSNSKFSNSEFSIPIFQIPNFQIQNFRIPKF